MRPIIRMASLEWIFFTSAFSIYCLKITKAKYIIWYLRAHSDNKIQKTDAIFSGLSRYSVEQQSPQNSIPTPTSSKAFANVIPGYDITFPFDHASHPEYAVEWWYITANLTDKQNNPYALQWTLFRFASDTGSTPWANAQQYMGHVGLRDGKQAWFEERFARGGVGNAGTFALSSGFLSNNASTYS